MSSEDVREAHRALHRERAHESLVRRHRLRAGRVVRARAVSSGALLADAICSAADTWTRILHPIIGLHHADRVRRSWPHGSGRTTGCRPRLAVAARMEGRREQPRGAAARGRTLQRRRRSCCSSCSSSACSGCCCPASSSGASSSRCTFRSASFGSRRSLHARVRIRADLRDHRAHLCCHLGEGLDAGDDARRRDARLGLEASSGLVPGDDPCNEFSNPVRLKPSRSDPYRGFACPIAAHLFCAARRAPAPAQRSRRDRACHRRLSAPDGGARRCATGGARELSRRRRPDSAADRGARANFGMPLVHATSWRRDERLARRAGAALRCVDGARRTFAEPACSRCANDCAAALPEQIETSGRRVAGGASAPKSMSQRRRS